MKAPLLQIPILILACLLATVGSDATFGAGLGPIFPLAGGTRLAARPDGTVLTADAVNTVLTNSVLQRDVFDSQVGPGETNQTAAAGYSSLANTRFYYANPDVAANATGGVVCFVEKVVVVVGDTDEFLVEFYLVDAAGQPTTPILSAANPEAWTETPTVRVAMNRAGQFAMGWFDQSYTTDHYVRGRVFGATGQPIGTNLYFTLNDQRRADGRFGALRPSVAIAPDGSSVYAWEDAFVSRGSAYVDYDPAHDIYARRVNTNGVPIGSQFRVNTTVNCRHDSAQIAMSTNGSFVVVWRQSSSDADGIYLQRFDAAGNRLGPEMHVSPCNGLDPQVATTADGRFVVAWQGQDDSGGGIFAQRFQADGSCYGGALWVNEGATNSQTKPLLGLADHGTSILKWTEGTNNFARWIAWDATNSMPLLGPWIRRFAPTEPVSIPVRGFELEFDHPILPESFTVDDLQVIDPLGRIVQGATIGTTNGQTFFIEMPERFVAGRYQVFIGTNIFDGAGFSLDQNANGRFGEVTDGFRKTFLASPHTASFPLNEGFEGSEDSLSAWSFDSTVPKTVSLTSVAPHGGLHHLRFNTELPVDDVKQSATVRIDLSAQASQTNLYLAFWAEGYASLQSSKLDVWLSGDGNSWHSLASMYLARDYARYVFDLDQAARDSGISLDGDVYLRFEHVHQNSYGLGFTQWVDLDDVRIQIGNPNAPILGAPVRAGSGQFQFQLSGPVGSNYVIEATSDFTTWTPLSTNTVPAGGLLGILDPDAPNHAHRFYRAQAR